MSNDNNNDNNTDYYDDELANYSSTIILAGKIWPKCVFN